MNNLTPTHFRDSPAKLFMFIGFFFSPDLRRLSPMRWPSRHLWIMCRQHRNHYQIDALTGQEMLDDFHGFSFLHLVVRIARPTSLTIWHRGRSHRRPNRSGSPNRRHFASLDLKKDPDFSHRKLTSQDFRRFFFWHFL